MKLCIWFVYISLDVCIFVCMFVFMYVYVCVVAPPIQASCMYVFLSLSLYIYIFIYILERLPQRCAKPSCHQPHLVMHDLWTLVNFMTDIFASQACWMPTSRLAKPRLQIGFVWRTHWKIVSEAVLQLVSASEICIQKPASGSSRRIGLQHLIASRRCASCKLMVPKRFEVLPHSQTSNVYVMIRYKGNVVPGATTKKAKTQRTCIPVWSCLHGTVSTKYSMITWKAPVGSLQNLYLYNYTNRQIYPYIYACHKWHSYCCVIGTYSKPSCSIVHVTLIVSKHSQETNGFSMLMTNHGGFLDKLTTTLTKTPVL